MSNITHVQLQATQTQAAAAPSEAYGCWAEFLSKDIQSIATLLSQLQADPKLADEQQFQSLLAQAICAFKTTMGTIQHGIDGLSSNEQQELEGIGNGFQAEVLNQPIPVAGGTATLASIGSVPNYPQEQALLEGLANDSSLVGYLSASSANTSNSLWSDAQSRVSPSAAGKEAAKILSDDLSAVANILSEIQQNPSLADDPQEELKLAQAVHQFWADISYIAKGEAYSEGIFLQNMMNEASQMVLSSSLPNGMGGLSSASEEALARNDAAMKNVLDAWTKNPGSVALMIQMLTNTAQQYSQYADQ